MIQINLVPDIKLELIRAQRHRKFIISGVTIAIITMVTITILLSIWVFMIQSFQIDSGANEIEKQHQKFVSIPDIEKSVTIANQIAKINDTHEQKNMMSRIFDVLAVASSKGTDNSVSITTIDVDADMKTITVTGQTDIKGFEAADVFRKNIEAIKVDYVPVNSDGTYDKSNTEGEEFLLAKTVDLSDLTLGRDTTSGQQHVTFKLSLEYDDQLFSPKIHVLRMQGLGAGNVTDSYSRLPKSLFTTSTDQLQPVDKQQNTESKD